MTIPETPDNEQRPNPKRIGKGSTKRVLVSGAENPHQVMSAGQTISFIFLTLLIGTLLNSSSLYTKASAKKPSFIRSSTMAFLRPFDLTSQAIGLTSARQKMRSALDLSRDDKLDTFTFADTKTKVKRPAPTPTSLPALTPENKLKTWIIGDSLSITPGESMQRHFPPDAFNIIGMQGQISTGLARPDVFNWFTHINDVVVKYHPQLIIATFGANDNQYLFGDSGAIGPFGTEVWRQEYSKRVSSTLDYLANQGVHTVWVAIPPVRDSVRNGHYIFINDIIRNAVEARPATATYVETAEAFTNADGSYSDALVINGTPTLLRAPDGIHFTRAGGDLISRLVLEKLHTLYSFK